MELPKTNCKFDNAKYFISEKLPEVGWGKSRDKELLLDVGCGSGANTFQFILPLFPLGVKIIAIDIRPDMIEFAKKRNYHPLIQYKVANIEDWSTVQQWEGQISKVTAINCVQWLKDARRGFQHMFQLLKNGGEMAICFAMASPVYASVWNLANNPKWSKLFKCADNYDLGVQAKGYESYHYKNMLEEMGFEIQYFKEEERFEAFTSDADYRNFLASKCSLVSHVPIHKKEEFKDYLLEGILRLNDRDSSGRILHRGSIFEVVAKKRRC